ncbi:MAG: long-chain fatty acid--CoA ligase [Paludibacteraceae bacterium]|nr:long-chain fatty acid--CoA ligase [Paludibacteraceae bacterium]
MAENEHCFNLRHIPAYGARRYGERPALFFKRNQENAKRSDLDNKRWIPLSWNDFNRQVGLAAAALRRLGISSGDKLAIYSQNRVESFILDFANFRLHGVTVPMYATSSPEQVAYIANDASVKLIFVGDERQFQAASAQRANIPSVTNVIRLYGNEPDSFSRLLEAEANAGNSVDDDGSETPDELATLIYTSGTTGNPKGVMLTHGNYTAALNFNQNRLSFDNTDRSLCFLPISHVFERAWSYLCLGAGAQVYVNYNPKDVLQSLREVRPTTMCAVPRFWEKVYLGVMRKALSAPSPMKAFAVWAFDMGRKYHLIYKNKNQKPNFWFRFGFFLSERLFLRRLRRVLGVDRGNFFPVAGSSLSNHILVFLKSLGIPLLYGYGLTETTATVSCFTNHNFRIGSIGEVLDGVDVKIGDEGEILVKGPTITQGYYKRPEANAAAFTADGYFRTGDAGRLEGRHLFMTDRIKDLMKTSNGKYIAPQQIEVRLSACPVIEQAAVIGDRRPYVTAIIVPDFESLRQHPDIIANHLETASDEQLINEKTVLQVFESAIAQALQGLAPFEQVKKFTLIRKGFSLEGGELSNTLKLRRAVITQKYADLIDSMYDRLKAEKTINAH